MCVSKIINNDYVEKNRVKPAYPKIDIAKTGQNIKCLMRINGMTVKDIQKFLGLGTPQSVYHWFDGRSLPTIDNIYALSEMFRVPVDALLVGNRKYRCMNVDDPLYRRLYAYITIMHKTVA